VEDVTRHGIILPDGDRVVEMVEKLQPTAAPSDLGALDAIARTPPGYRGEDASLVVCLDDADELIAAGTLPRGDLLDRIAARGVGASMCIGMHAGMDAGAGRAVAATGKAATNLYVNWSAGNLPWQHASRMSTGGIGKDVAPGRASSAGLTPSGEPGSSGGRCPWCATTNGKAGVSAPIPGDHGERSRKLRRQRHAGDRDPLSPAPDGTPAPTGSAP